MTDCALRNGCSFQANTWSPEEQRRLLKEYYEAKDQLNFEYTDFIQKVDNDIRDAI